MRFTASQTSNVCNIGVDGGNLFFIQRLCFIMRFRLLLRRRVRRLNTMKRTHYYILAAVLAMAALGYTIAQQTSPAVISVHETYGMLRDTTVLLLDVRTAQEHAAQRITESLLIPVQELELRIHELNRFKDKKIVVYCRSGNRSSTATEILRKYGFNAYNMSGGMLRWNEERLPAINGVHQ